MIEYPEVYRNQQLLFTLSVILIFFLTLVMLFSARQLSKLIDKDNKITKKQIVLYSIILILSIGLNASITYVVYRLQSIHSHSVVLYYLERLFNSTISDNEDMPVSKFLINLDNSNRGVKKLTEILPDVIKVLGAGIFIVYLIPETWFSVLLFYYFNILSFLVFNNKVDATLMEESKHIQQFASKLDDYYKNKNLFKSLDVNVKEIKNSVHQIYKRMQTDLVTKNNIILILGTYVPIVFYFLFIVVIAIVHEIYKKDLSLKVFLIFVLVDCMYSYFRTWQRMLEYKRLRLNYRPLKNYSFKQKINGYAENQINRDSRVIIDVNKLQIDNTKIKNLSFKLQRGESVVLHGPSGCGKSTLLKIFTQQNKKFSGQISVYGKNILHLSENFYFSKVAFVDHNLLLLNNMTFNEHFSMFFTDDKKIKYNLQEKERIMNQLFLTPHDLESKKVHMLSQGEKQRICLLLILLFPVEILILDEYLSALNVSMAQDIHAFVLSEIEKRNMCAIFVLHQDFLFHSCTYSINLGIQEEKEQR